MIDFAEFKKFFMFNLIGSLIISAIVAVITVLTGTMNEITGKVFTTLFMVVAHSLISLAFIWDDERQKTFERLSFFINILFVLIVISFVTSILGIWGIILGDIVWRLYMTYFVIAFASLHGDILSKALRRENYMDVIIYLNYVFMAIVALMLQPVIYTDNATRVLGEIYFRLLGAAAIIDGTLSILTIIFYKLYMNKHLKLDNPLQDNLPQAETSQKAKRGLSIWVWILIVYLFVQIVFPMVFYGGRFFFR